MSVSIPEIIDFVENYEQTLQNLPDIPVYEMQSIGGDNYKMVWSTKRQQA